MIRLLTKEQIESYLTEMDVELAKRHLTGEIVLCGGAVMTLVYDARQSTKDIDALFEPTRELRQIALQMAERYGLNNDWFNDAAKAFIDTSRMSFEPIMDMAALRVLRPNDEGMLAMKLASARENSKDADDAVFLIRRLGITDENELLDMMERNMPKQRLTPMAGFFAKEMLKRALKKSADR